jgi:leucyl aminopeptidase
MAVKSGKKARELWGFSEAPLIIQALARKAQSGRGARVHIDTKKKAAAPSRTVDSDSGVEIFLSPLAGPEAEKDARLKSNPSARLRDSVGGVLTQLEKMDVQHVEFRFSLDAKGLEAALLGLEIGLYRFKRVYRKEPLKFTIAISNHGRVVSEKQIRGAALKGQAVNLARHLTNLPPNVLNPVTYAEACSLWMRGLRGVKVEIWDEKRLAKENCHLHLGVGQASVAPPRLVQIRYRGAGAKKGPVAFVGKGVTFDSGGLDIKPSAGMRLMKKDMGGSAAVFALAYWAAQSQARGAMDFYMPLAENAISGTSFHPSDILIARNGESIEIHNTDAEGRLVLADAMDVAATQKEKPAAIVDVATLTGAIKVALGSGLTGLFANDAKLAQAIASAGQRAGDLCWQMPLFQKYRAQMNTVFADYVNAVDGFGGAITAALFLEKFARGIPWAHLDIYAWKDGAEGAWLESGGSGQAVLALAEWLVSRK